jgi:hypothetical protein
MPDASGHFTYTEWLNWTVNKIATNALQHTPEEHRDGYLRVQIKAAIQQALAHGRSGRTDDDPVVGPLSKGPLP